ncbi:thymidylate kinase [Lasallia pustulata]|uniref:Thymidylate kinase n=1 Tax=Lasallia pustulata TaxID=136370 RepID=A0A1W5DES6_9LECA|nr:thymidylate kinase [Lasallia pustulata]
MGGGTRGALIVIEGLDRAGKSTQCERLASKLEGQGRRVKRMRFPDRTTPIGQSINAYLQGESQQEDHVIHLLFSANRWEAAAQIRADIADGITIIIDRYYYSGIVYSAAKDNPSLTLSWAREPEVGLPRPDVCIFLDISPEDAAERGGFGLEKYENDKMQRRVRELFYRLADLPDGNGFRIVDAGRSLEKVEEEVLVAVESTIRSLNDSQVLKNVEPWPEGSYSNG